MLAEKSARASVLTRGLRNSGSILALGIALGLSSAHAGALPGHGHFVSGQGLIAKGNQSVTVKQSSTTGIIDWNSFSVGKKNGVTFDNGSGATLNRVTGGNLSTIAGSLHATGSLYLMNSSGVIVSGTGHIVTGGNFVATSGNIADSAFGDGDRRFKPGAGNIVNRGTIVSGGSASLIGRNVSDSGSIRATGAELSATQRLGISGSIVARSSNGSGGAVTARAGTIVIGTDGDIDTSASGAGQKGGTVSVVARGTTTVAGTLSANGGSNGSGGFIDTSGEHLHVADGAKISTLAANGKTGTWLIDPQDFTIAASGGDITGATLSHNLASNNVVIQSSKGATSGNGDIFVDDALSWSSGHTLTLDAYRNIVFNAPITISGAGRLTLIDADQTQTPGTVGVNDGNAADGDLIFNQDGNVAFTNVASGDATALSINGQAYTLENNVSDLAGAIATTPAGFYALAKNYDASNDGTYGASPIPTTFTGTFEGLGNAISNLTINDGAATDDVGLFAVIGTGGIVRDIGLTNVNIQAADESKVGALAGEMDGGTIVHSYSTGTVSAGADESDVGGLVGFSSGTMTADHSSATVTIGDASVPAAETADVGGLVGDNDGTISYSYATGAVSDTTQAHTGTEAPAEPDAILGGLVGSNSGDISYSYATGAVTGQTDDYVGGLVGESDNGTVSYSYATGNVAAASGKAGGFIGDTGGGTISESYATGAVSDAAEGAKVGGFVGYNDGATIETSYATGNATDVGTGTTQGSGSDTSDVGGFIGDNNSGSVTTSYASGTVVGGSDADAGGFAGLNEGTVNHSYAIGSVSGGGLVGGFAGQNGSTGTIDESYSIGKATGSAGAFVGGFAGDNDNTSGISASVGDYYNSTANTGAGIGADGAANPSDVHGLTLAQMLTATNFSEWTDFGTTAGGSGWVIVDNDGSLNNESGTGGTTPMLLSEYSTTITNAHQLQLMELDPGASYTLATNIDASATGTGNDVWGSQGFIPIGGNAASTFTGTFDGQDHVIDGLTMASTATGPSNIYSGLFGRTDDATITNVGLTNVSVTGVSDSAQVGGLIGSAFDSTVSGVYVTGQVAGGTASAVGGLIGLQDNGTVSQSWANAAVTAGATAHSTLSEAAEISGVLDGGTIDQSFGSGTVIGGSGSTIGGLAGFMDDNATIDNSYSMVAVIANSGNSAGGIAGYESLGTIENSYAVGIVGGSAQEEGGLVGSGGNGSGSNLVNTYWDTQTTGQALVSGYGAEAGATGKTTAQLQSHLPSGFDNTVWGTGPSLFPYLLWQYPKGAPQAVSGFAYSDHGVTGLSDASVALLIGGDAMGTVATGANGYYYFLETPGTISGSSVLTYLSGTGGVAFADNATGSVSGLDIDNNYLNETTAGSSYATLASDLTTAISGNSAVQTIVSGLANQGIDYTGGATFNIDSAISLGSGTLAIDSNGSVNQTVAIGASELLLLGDADYTLDNTGNAIATVAGHTTGSLDLTSDEALTVGSVLGTNGLYVGGGATVQTTAGGIAITQRLTADAHPLSLISAGTIAESGAGAIAATSLDGSSHGAVALNGANAIADLGTFSTGGGNAFALTDNQNLTTTGTVNAGAAGNITLTTTGSGHAITVDSKLKGNVVDLVSAAAIGEINAGDIDAKTLQGSSHGAVHLTSTKNTVTNLGAFTTAGKNFSLTDNHNLTTTGTVNAGAAGDITLTTTGAGHTIAVDSELEGSLVDLVSAAAISESSAGDIDAKNLRGSAHGAVALTSAQNAVTDLGAFTTGKNFSLTDNHNLTTTGTVKAGAAGDITLTTTGSGHSIAVDSELEGSLVDLVSAAAIGESSAGDIDAKVLRGSAHGAVALTSADNAVINLGAFTTAGKSFSLTDDHSLTVKGAVSAGNGKLSLTTVGANHNLAIAGTVTGSTVNLTTTGKATETAQASIAASTVLNVTATSGIKLTSKHNAIKKLGTDITVSGPNKVTL